MEGICIYYLLRPMATCELRRATHLILPPIMQHYSVDKCHECCVRRDEWHALMQELESSLWNSILRRELRYTNDDAAGPDVKSPDPLRTYREVRTLSSPQWMRAEDSTDGRWCLDTLP